MRVTIRNFYKNREAFIKGASLFLLDIILTIGCMVGALWLRFDFSFTKIEPVFWDSVRDYMWINVACTVAINALCKLYTSLWRFASLEELKNAVIAIVVLFFHPVCGDEDPGQAGAEKLHFYIRDAVVRGHYRAPVLLPVPADRLPQP